MTHITKAGAIRVFDGVKGARLVVNEDAIP